MTPTQPPHAGEPDLAVSLPIYAWHFIWAADSTGIMWQDWYDADDPSMPQQWDDAGPDEKIAVVRLSDAQAMIERLTRERDAAHEACDMNLATIDKLLKAHAALEASRPDVDAIMALAADFATLYGRLHFERQCGGPITKIGEEVDAARSALRAMLEGRT